MLTTEAIVADRYRLRLPLGQRALGSVWRADDLKLRSSVALAILEATDTPMRELFLERARTAAKLRHPHVVEILDVGQTATGAPYCAMELIEGQSLAERFGERPELETAAFIRIIDMVLRGLSASHAQSLVHGDIEPGTILLVDFGDDVIAKIIGFALSRATARTGRLPPELSEEDDGLLRTLAYAAPEQAQLRSDIDGRADLYSVGIVVYAGLTGVLPYRARNEEELREEIVRGGAPPVSRLQAQIGPTLTRVIERAIAVDREDRYDTAEEMRSALAHAIECDVESRGMPLPIHERALSVQAPAPDEPRPEPPGPREREEKSESERAVSEILEQGEREGRNKRESEHAIAELLVDAGLVPPPAPVPADLFPSEPISESVARATAVETSSDEEAFKPRATDEVDEEAAATDELAPEPTRFVAAGVAGPGGTSSEGSSAGPRPQPPPVPRGSPVAKGPPAPPARSPSGSNATVPRPGVNASSAPLAPRLSKLRPASGQIQTGTNAKPIEPVERSAADKSSGARELPREPTRFGVPQAQADASEGAESAAKEGDDAKERADAGPNGAGGDDGAVAATSETEAMIGARAKETKVEKSSAAPPSNLLSTVPPGAIPLGALRATTDRGRGLDKRVLGAIGAAVVVVVIAIVWGLGGSGGESEEADHVHAAGPSGEEEQPAAPEHEEQRTQPVNTAQQGVGPAPGVREITIRMEGVPEGARIEHDGHRAEGPELRIPRDDRVHVLAVTAPGHVPWRRRVFAREDITVRVDLQPEAVQAAQQPPEQTTEQQPSGLHTTRRRGSTARRSTRASRTKLVRDPGL